MFFDIENLISFDVQIWALTVFVNVLLIYVQHYTDVI